MRQSTTHLVYRIGVNLGDVLIEGDDILGDGVNIAARLESVYEPGGIFVSGAAFWLRRSIETNRNYPTSHFLLAAALARLGGCPKRRLKLGPDCQSTRLSPSRGFAPADPATSISRATSGSATSTGCGRPESPNNEIRWAAC